MTSINLFVQPAARAGFLVTDSAVTDEDGILREICGKVIYGHGRFPWAVGISGSIHPVEVVQMAGALNPLSLKQLYAALPALALKVAQRPVPAGTKVRPHLVMTGCAWSFREKRPVGFSIASEAGLLFEGSEAAVLYEMHHMFTGADVGSLSELVGREVDPADPLSFDPAADGLALVKSQRRAGAGSPVEGIAKVATRIGGGILLTQVTKKGVTHWEIHDFKDPLGSVISA